MKKKIEELMNEIHSIQDELKDAHQLIDDYYAGRLQPMLGMGPYAQSNRISWCNKRLAEIQTQLVQLGMDEKTAGEICQEAPASGYVYDRCMEFIKKYSA